MPEGAGLVKQTDIMIRPPKDVGDMSVCVELQRRIWGYTELDTVPEQMFVVAKESGGQVLVAYDREQAIGFALAYAGAHLGAVHLHSHMVGVVPEYQDQGVGRLLKYAQRDEAIERGIDLIEWTFDPLQLKNAHFNLARLGAIVRRYIPNCYGRTSSPLHAGLPTDRLVAEWWLRSSRVKTALRGEAHAPAADRVRIPLPVSIRQICTNDLPEAERIQSQVRKQFEKHLAEGRVAIGFDQQQSSYVLEPYED
jgi:predicted GNAT superfamily acetyltransferase